MDRYSTRTPCVLLFRCISSITYHIGQSNGIRLVRTLGTLDGSFSPQACTATIITSKSWSIGLLYPRRGSRRPCRSHRSQFALTRLAHAHTWWICNAAVPHNTPRRISRHASLLSITVQNVADFFFAASRVYCWHRSLVEYMGCKARRWRD
jgi:hypothetical protein